MHIINILCNYLERRFIVISSLLFIKTLDIFIFYCSLEILFDQIDTNNFDKWAKRKSVFWNAFSHHIIPLIYLCLIMLFYPIFWNLNFTLTNSKPFLFICNNWPIHWVASLYYCLVNTRRYHSLVPSCVYVL